MKLTNGAKVVRLSMKATSSSSVAGYTGVVLAQTVQNEFVTWAVDGEGNTVAGHYFGTTKDDEKGALRDYKSRCSKAGLV